MRPLKYLIFLAAFAAAIPAYGAKEPACPLPSGASRSYAIADLPKAIQTDFMGRIGGSIAAPGKYFEATDEILFAGAPRRRLIEIQHFNDRWLIHYEAGGIVLTEHLVAYRMPQSGGDVELYANFRAGSVSDPCRLDTSLLTDPVPARPVIDSVW
jgi:hypothetical protein